MTIDSIAKRCPNGYHKDENGNCVNANGEVYQGKQEQPKQDRPKQDKKKPKERKFKDMKWGDMIDVYKKSFTALTSDLSSADTYDWVNENTVLANMYGVSGEDKKKILLALHRAGFLKYDPKKKKVKLIRSETKNWENVRAEKMKKSKVKKKTSIYSGKWYWEFDNPSDRAFIDEVRNNGVVTDLKIERGHAFRTYDYNGQRYEVIEHPDYPDGYGDMTILEPEPDYSVLTFDLFKKTIEDYLKQHSFADMPLDEYTFHDLGNGHYTFSYDGDIYELMNYDDTGNFKWGLHDALENAGFEWGVNIEQDTYSDIGYYNHANKSTKKSKKMKKSNVSKDFRKDIRDTPEFREITSEIEYVIDCMGEDIRRFGGFGTSDIQKYKEQVISDTNQIMRCIERMEKMEDGDFTASAKKSKVNKSTIDFHEGMTLREFFEKNHNPNQQSIMGFDLYSVDLNGRQVATNYTGVKEEYLDYIVESYNFDNMIDFVMLTINIRPNGTGNEFVDMVDKMRNTRRFRL